MTKRTERGHLQSFDGSALYFANDEVAAPRGHVLLVHGFAEHCERYGGVVAALNARGYSTYRYDMRGHGRSDGVRGHIFKFDEYLADLRVLRDRVRAAADGPIFLAAHSNGGLVSLLSVAASAEGVAGLALSSPFFDFGFPVPALKAAAGRLMSRFLPALGLPTELDPASVSHDPEVVAEYGTDPLIGKVASTRWFTETLAAHQAARAQAPAVRVPCLLQQAGDDRIASPTAARAVFELIGSPDKTWIEYPGLYHEIWFELERARTVGDLLDWLDQRS